MCEYIPTQREKERPHRDEPKVYDIIGEIRVLQAEQDSLINKLIDQLEINA
jgi:hypothetical protein